jgi:AAA15 family ATPase/GTPase
MLIEFNVENVLSFKDLTTFSMVAAKSFKEHRATHTVAIDDKLSLLKSAIVYGNNASGKTNFLKAMNFMKVIVLNSFRDALTQGFSIPKFALNTQSQKDSSFFEIIFIQQNIKYRYGFEITADKITAEWLFHTTTKEVYLFRREFQKIEINKSAFKEAIGKDSDVRENVLFLSLLATLGKEIASSIIDWFKKLNFLEGTHDHWHKSYTVNKLKIDKEFLNWALRFVKYLEIANLAISETNQQNIEIVFNTNESPSIQTKPIKQDKLLTLHRQYDENNIFVDTVAFDFDNQESEGTKKLLYLLGPWYEALQKGQILVVDELDSRFHSRLTWALIEFFHRSNIYQAQLIGAAQDVSLLNKKLFRRDQIWFVEKNQFGASELVSLAAFKTDKVRKQSAFDKNYLEGKYGAIPYFDTDQTLNELLYEQREAAQI